MNKLTFFLCLLSIQLYSQSNHSLTSERNAYRAGDKLVKQQIEYKDAGSAGKNLLWDFRGINLINENYTLDYFITDSSRMDTLCGIEHNTRYYYYQNNNSLWAIGFENSTTNLEYQQPELKLRFPLSYGDTLYSKFNGQGEYCHRDSIKVSGYTRVLVDAEGDLMLPWRETVKRALRVRTTRYYTQTGNDSIEMLFDTFSWYALGIRYPVFESIKTTLTKNRGQAGGADTVVFNTSFYYPPELQTSQVQTDSIPTEPDITLAEAAAIFTEAQLMPNPVLDNLHINFKLTRAAKVWFTVNNNSGIPLCQTNPQYFDEGYQNVNINMAGLINGVYSLVVHIDDMVMRLNVVKL